MRRKKVVEIKRAEIAVLVSGNGTNLQALLDAENFGVLEHGHISLVISSKEGAYALKRAGRACIKTMTLDRKKLGKELFERELAAALEGYDLIVLAGFMCILSEDFTRKFDKKIINIHPSLIPSFCGEGFYGLHVHEAALKRGVKVTGATVHYVNEIPDGGEIIMQKAVRVRQNDTPETLQARVMREAERIILPRAAEKICREMFEKEEEEKDECI